MSTVDRPAKRTFLPLVDGERLDRATFHERYAAMPPETRAELIGGVVFMASPAGYAHGNSDVLIHYWLASYCALTPGVSASGNTTTQFEDYGEPQPDSQHRIAEECGGQSRIIDNYTVGAPELVVEVSHTTRKKDLGPKKADYERAGVLEYVFVGLEPDEVRWFTLRDGKFVETYAAADGIFRSEVFPGLWLNPGALLSQDILGVRTTVERGLATREHAEFVKRLEDAKSHSAR